MKVTVEVDCTPVEARQFFGLPDVQPMQKTMMAELEKTMLKEAERYSPESLMKLWVGSMPQGAEWFRDMFGSMLVTGSKKPPADPAP